MSCDVQFGEFGFWSVRCAAFSDLMHRAIRNTENKVAMDLCGFADVCGCLNVFRYPEGDIRREIVHTLRRAAQEWVTELSAMPDVPEGTIGSIQRLIAITDAVLGETPTTS
jgi:hypothetical protein